MAGLFDPLPPGNAPVDGEGGARASAPTAAPAPPPAPLADRMRPRSFEEFVGQSEVVGLDRPLRRLLAAGKLPSLVLWGPPGSGKTTLARLLAAAAGHDFLAYSAVTSGIREIKEVMERARQVRGRRGRRTILFIDELHRFNRAQQDAFLPAVEDGTIVLVGATTENPSFEVNAALLSRCRVLVLSALTAEEIRCLLERALGDGERGLGGLGLTAEPAALAQIARAANGDARVGLTLLEIAAQAAAGGGAAAGARLTPELVAQAAQHKALAYDRAGEEHYNIISALHKSLRGGDAQASLYWLGRMLEAGEDPLYVARRLVRFASEDVGLADPQALVQAVAAKEAVHFVGLPEGVLALAQLTVYLAVAPKSNALYTAYAGVKEDLRGREAPPVPLWIRNATTELMAAVGYGKGYQYPHDHPDAVVDQEYLPESLRGRVYYTPTRAGFEVRIAERMAAWDVARAALRAAGAASDPPAPAGPPRGA
ncbi:MAG: replication-associated recombination protein A [Planctomycetes bacterium]|nr:replication-associated recombination protein A [Planctomycetota bacterium]